MTVSAKQSINHRQGPIVAEHVDFLLVLLCLVYLPYKRAMYVQETNLQYEQVR